MNHRIAAGLMILLGLAGCNLATEPANVLVNVSEEYLTRAEGCAVRFNAEAIGTTRADWGEVLFGTEDAVIARYSGTEFWGTSGILPGEELTSIALDLLQSDQQYIVHMTFFTGRTAHEFLFGARCPSDEV